jgi:hypothetical protein
MAKNDGDKSSLTRHIYFDPRLDYPYDPAIKSTGMKSLRDHLPSLAFRRERPAPDRFAHARPLC